MATFRQITVLFILALASVGNLPLVAHHFTCHDAAPQLSEGMATANSCSCSHHCEPTIEFKSADGDVGLSATDVDDCAACYQLSQVSQSTSNALHVQSYPAVSPLVVTPAKHHLQNAQSSHAPRGPPAA
ncbi:MAG: hypothetical protein SFV81_24625 [Pirellulaceae bacterium]|nr:hypothetical protein [Pirellulaceae bacterium]